MLGCLLHAADAGGAEGDELLPGEAVRIEEGVNDGGLTAPPDGRAEKHHVILLHVLDLADHGGAAGLILHFPVGAAVGNVEVQIVRCIGLHGLNLKEIGILELCQLLRHLRSIAGGGKTSDQNVAHLS